MKNERLQIVQGKQYRNNALSSRHIAQEKFDKLWEKDPKQFDPLRNCMERERLDRTYALISGDMDLSGKIAVDIGCAGGTLTRRLRDAGAIVHAVDVSEEALKILQKEDMSHIRAHHDCAPATRLEDGRYELVVCTDLIAYLKIAEQRLLFSELARLVKRGGIVVCSTPIDINSEDALKRFAALAETELQIRRWKFSYHRLYIRLKDFIEAPIRFSKALNDPEYREREIARRHAVARTWFKINSAPGLGHFWNIAKYAAAPIAAWIRQSRSMMLFLEKISHFVWQETGISHAIFVGNVRPLVEEQSVVVFERKQKKTVWE